MLSLKGNTDTGPDSKDNINSNVESVSFLGVALSNSAIWNTYVGGTEGKPAECIRNFVEAHILLKRHLPWATQTRFCLA